MGSHKDGVLAAIDQALSLVSCETVRALLRTLINMLVEQATSTANVPTITCCDCGKVITLTECRTSYAAFNLNGLMCSDCVTKLRTQVADGKINDAAVDAIAAERDVLLVQLEESRGRERRLEEQNRGSFEKIYPHGRVELRKALGRLCLGWYNRYAANPLHWRMSEAYMDDQVERISGNKPLDGNASDAACAVVGTFNKVREEMQL